MGYEMNKQLAVCILARSSIRYGLSVGKSSGHDPVRCDMQYYLARMSDGEILGQVSVCVFNITTTT